MNQLYELWEKHSAAKSWDYDVIMKDIEARRKAVHTYSWAVPTSQALSLIAHWSENKVVEIGAGTGYWAMLLNAIGVDIIAYDRMPCYNEQANARWYEVQQGGPGKAFKHPNRALMLCWPPYDAPMAYNAVRAYRGDTAIYIGEGMEGVTGDRKFHELLIDEWDKVDSYPIPRWFGIRDRLFVYKRLPK